jgi:RNA polymerase sigma-70 factor, ECF subfamily
VTGWVDVAAQRAIMNRDSILTSLRERIVAFATLRVSKDLAEDLAQDVLAVLHDKYPHVVELTELVPLAFQVLRYKMLDVHRKALRRGEYNQESVDDLALAAPEGTPETQLDQKQRVERLLAALAQLGERCRALFKWKLEGKSFPEIQQLMGQKSINTIYTWDLRCRKQLLSLMGGSWS